MSYDYTEEPMVVVERKITMVEGLVRSCSPYYRSAEHPGRYMVNLTTGYPAELE